MLFTALLLILSSVPVLAAESPLGPAEEIVLAPSSLEAQAGWLPDVTDVEEGLAAVVREEAARERELERPEAIRERNESRDAFAGVDAAQAQELLQTVFEEELARLDTDPARSISNAEAVRTVGRTTAVVTEEGNSALLDAGMPLKAKDENGNLGKVDLTLTPTQEGFETTNAISRVHIGDSAAEPVVVGDSGIAITQLGVADASSSRSLEGEAVFQFETSTDTDTLVAPVASGAEIFNLLRSEESPEVFRFEIDLPQGAELRPDGHGGAEIVRDGEALGLIPFPTAIDAQGTDVPVDFSIDGSVITLHVDHRVGDYAMPILLDPQVLEDWVNSWSSWQNGHNLDALSNGAWKWTSDPYGLIYFGTGCFYTCWGPGLYLTAPARNYGANTYSQWAYSAPNIHSYISKVWLIPFWRDNHGCSQSQYSQPHDYDGFWGDNQWNLLQTNQANDVGSVAVESWGRAFIVGLHSGGGINIPCWRDVYVGGAAVWLDDWNQPVLNTTSTYQWMDASPVRLDVRATDIGLGVRKFEAEALNKSGAMQKWETWHPCVGTYASRCPETWNLNESSQPKLAYDPSVLPEGIVTLNVTAFDATLRKSTMTHGVPVRIDHAPPSIKLSGTITEQATLGTEKPKYTVRVDAADGIPKDPDPADARSGVVSISEWIDGKKVNEYAPGCSTQSCSHFDEGAVEAAAYSKGKHTLIVKATDALGHVASQQLEFSLGDTQAPTLDVTGLPGESSAMPLWPIHSTSFGSYGGPNGQFRAPGDIAIDSQGNLWVADKENHRIQKFDSSGKFLAAYGDSQGSGDGEFKRPSSIAIDAAGDILVADSNNHRIQKLSPEGDFISKFGSFGTGDGQLNKPEEVIVDLEGNIWVADTLNGRVQKFNDKGEFLKVVDSGQLYEPTGMDVDAGGNVWVSDWQKNRLSVFDEEGEFKSNVGSAGSGDGQFNHPEAIEIDGEGNVWVGDAFNNRVQRFDLAGQYQGQFGSAGAGDGQFSLDYPMGIATDDKGHLWITDVNNHRVQKWLVPNTTVYSGHLEPLNASATDGGYGMGSITVKLTNQSGETETLGHTSGSCSDGGCPLDYKLEELNLSEKPRGTYLLSVTATDLAGNVKEVSRFLNLDSTPPELELSGSLAEGAGQPLNAPSAELEIDASDSDPVSGGVSRVNVERNGQLVASYPSDCFSDCREVDASYTFQTAADGAKRSIKSVSAAGNGSIGELRRVSCVASNDCWAMGRTKYTPSELSEGKVAEELLERWNGTEWHAITIPKPAGATGLTLEDISCASASACLAVGSYDNGTSQPLTEFWDGTKWTAGTGPLPAGAAKGILSGVSCGAAGDCWVYGETEVSPAEMQEGKVALPFLSRWNGTEWHAITIPKPAGATGLTLEDISCASASACLAVGSYDNGTSQPLTEFWDGTKWTAGTGPLPAGAAKGILSGVSCGSAGDCWTYGKTEVSSAEMQEGKTAVPFFSRWNGSEWQVEAIEKAPEGSPTTVTSLSCASATACTAVGRYTNPYGDTLPLAYTWDSAGWRFQPMPTKTEATDSSLEGVSCTAANECVSVGYSRVGSGQWQVLAAAEQPDGGPHEITVEAIDLQGNTVSETIEIDVDPTTVAPPECDTEPELEAAQGVLTPNQAVDAIEEALPAAVAPTDGATAPSTEEVIDPSYSPPSPNLETVDSLATGETSVTPEGGFTLGDSVCFTPATLTPASSDAAVVNGDAALFANTAPETDTVIRPTAMGTTVIQSLRGPNAPDVFAWNVKLSPGQDLVELPSGAVAVVETGSEVEEVAQVPPEPEKSSADLADVEVQVENGEYQLINAAEETQLEVVAVIARPWVVLAQGGIVPALIEVAITETPNEFEVWVKLPETPEEEEVWPAQLIVDGASASSVNGNCTVKESPCGGLDLNRMAQYAVYWGNEAHNGARNGFYADFGSDNCTNFISQILRAGGGKFMRAFEHGDGSWWYYNLGSGGIFGDGPSAGWDATQSWLLADVLPRHLWRFGLAYIDSVQQPWGWTKGNILAYDWIDSDGKGNVNHLSFVVGTQDMANGREPMVANSSSQGANYSNMLWRDVKKRIQDAHGSQWTRFSLAARHRVANLKAKKHDPDNLYGPNGLFHG